MWIEKLEKVIIEDVHNTKQQKYVDHEAKRNTEIDRYLCRHVQTKTWG